MSLRRCSLQYCCICIFVAARLLRADVDDHDEMAFFCLFDLFSIAVQTAQSLTKRRVFDGRGNLTDTVCVSVSFFLVCGCCGARVPFAS